MLCMRSAARGANLNGLNAIFLSFTSYTRRRLRQLIHCCIGNVSLLSLCFNIVRRARAFVRCALALLSRIFRQFRLLSVRSSFECTYHLARLIISVHRATGPSRRFTGGLLPVHASTFSTTASDPFLSRRKFRIRNPNEN